MIDGRFKAKASFFADGMEYSKVLYLIEFAGSASISASHVKWRDYWKACFLSGEEFCGKWRH